MKKTYLPLLLLFFSLNLFSQELITTNSSFASGFDGWSYGVWGDDAGTPKAKIKKTNDIGHTDSSCIEIKVTSNTKNGAGNKVLLMRKPLKIKKGKSYTLTFWVRSRYYDDEVYVSLYSGPDTGGKYTDWAPIFFQDFQFTGDNKWYKITHNFIAESNMGKADFKKMALIFGFDKRKGTFWIDDVSLVLN